MKNFKISSVRKSLPQHFRKLRTNSYRRAISTPPKIVVDLPCVTEVNSSPNKEPLYQEVAESGVLNESVEDDQTDVIKAVTGRSLIRRSTMRQSWSLQPQVQESGILTTITTKEKKRQEAMYELITSESSYLRSLGILVNYFMKSQDLRSSITNTEFHHLFSNVESVKAASEKFFSKLEKRRKSSPAVTDDVCDIVCDFVTSGLFDPYITYCSNETYQQKALQRLMNSNTKFVEVLRTLERGKKCSSLPLHSFLLLPMQRITRLPLLIDTIRQRCDEHTTQYRTASSALWETTQLVKICNERAKSLERTEQMVQLQHQLDFKSSRSFALISSNRYLLKQGVIVKVTEDVVLGFRRLSKQEIYLFLFNDVLIIAKKKSNDSYAVTDYCYKNRLRARDIINDACSFILVMEENQDGQSLEMRLEADKPNTKARWMTAMKPSQKHTTKITSDTMQVEIVRSLITNEPDMTSLKVMDVYIALNTTSDGWIYGDRISDGCRAWFPATHCQVISNEKTRERNLQRRNRLMGEQTVV